MDKQEIAEYEDSLKKYQDLYSALETENHLEKKKKHKKFIFAPNLKIGQ